VWKIGIEFLYVMDFGEARAAYYTGGNPDE
jgi:hypothetical protein